MFPILWLQTQSHLSAGLHCPEICLYAPRDSSNGPIKNSIRKCFNQNTLSDITESPEFSFKIGAHRWKTLIAVVTSLVSKCILFMLCCWWNWLLMCILSILCIMNKNFKIYEKGLPSFAAVVPERQRKGGSAASFCWERWSYESIGEFYIFKRGKCPLPSTSATAYASFREHFFSASCGSFSKVNQTPIKCLQEEMLLMLPSGICWASQSIRSHYRSLWHH